MQRSVRSGSRQPVMRSLRRNHGRPHATSPGRKIRETVQSTVDRQQSPGNQGPAERRPPPNAVRASPERSDTRAPVNLPQAEPSPRAKRAVGEGRRPAPVSYPVRKDDKPRHLTNERPGRPASCSFLIHRWFGAGIPGHVLFSSIYWRICSSVIRYSWPTRTA